MFDLLLDNSGSIRKVADPVRRPDPASKVYISS